MSMIYLDAEGVEPSCFSELKLKYYKFSSFYF